MDPVASRLSWRDKVKTRSLVLLQDKTSSTLGQVEFCWRLAIEHTNDHRNVVWWLIEDDADDLDRQMKALDKVVKTMSNKDLNMLSRIRIIRMPTAASLTSFLVSKTGQAPSNLSCILVPNLDSICNGIAMSRQMCLGFLHQFIQLHIDCPVNVYIVWPTNVREDDAKSTVMLSDLPVFKYCRQLIMIIHDRCASYINLDQNGDDDMFTFEL